ncbi:MAG: hypothetical protein ACI808_001939 [Paraglaciecola sp.]|jgi:hypothetical protein
MKEQFDIGSNLNIAEANEKKSPAKQLYQDLAQQTKDNTLRSQAKKRARKL